jgi:hypothetical protein
MSIQQTQSQWTKVARSNNTNDSHPAAATRARSVSRVHKPSADASSWGHDHSGEDFAFAAADGAKSMSRSRVHHFYRVQGATAAARAAQRAEADAFKPLRRHSKPDPKGVSGRRKPKHHVRKDTA